MKEKIYLSELISSVFNTGQYAFFERGNIGFCTSMNAPAYAHGHIVNINYYKRNIFESIFKIKDCNETDSLINGFSLISDKNEYLLAGMINSRWLTVSPFSSPLKRYIRSILMENVSYETVY